MRDPLRHALLRIPETRHTIKRTSATSAELVQIVDFAVGGLKHTGLAV